MLRDFIACSIVKNFDFIYLLEEIIQSKTPTYTNINLKVEAVIKKNGVIVCIINLVP